MHLILDTSGLACNHACGHEGWYLDVRTGEHSGSWGQMVGAGVGADTPGAWAEGEGCVQCDTFPIQSLLDNIIPSRIPELQNISTSG